MLQKLFDLDLYFPRHFLSSERARVYELVAGIKDRNTKTMQQIHLCIADPLLALGALKGNVNHVPLWCCSYVDIRTMGVCG